MKNFFLSHSGLRQTGQLTILFAIVSIHFLIEARAVPLPNKTLVYCSEGSPAGFDPGQFTSSIEFSAGANTIYNRLIDFELGGTKIEPSLAEKWDISSDGLTYTFTLRRHVSFHTTSFFKPTRPFNAEDVLFTFERMRNPKMPFRKAYMVEFPYWQDTGFDRIIEKIEAPNPYTVRFILKNRDATFLANLATSFASIHSAEYANQLLKAGRASDLNWKPVGTGPFMFRSYIKDVMIRFEGHPDYWQPSAVQISRLIFSITPDTAVRTQKLRRNECQIGVNPRPSDLISLKADPNIRILSAPSLNMGYLAYNTTHPPLGDTRVRKALDMAINKKAIIDTVFSGTAEIAVAPMPPLQWSYDKTLKDTPRNITRAKELLSQAGYPNGLTLSLWAMPVQRPYNPNARLMAELIQADWQKIGVKAKIVSYEWGEYLKRSHHGEHDTLLIGWSSDNGDPDNWLGMLLGCSAAKQGGNYSKWCDAPFDNLIRQAQQSILMTERLALYHQAQKIFKQQQPFTPIAYSNVYQPIRKNVTGFKINPFGLTDFHGVSLK